MTPLWPWKMAGQACAALMAAILLGLLLELPFAIVVWPIENEEIYRVRSAPVDDASLTAWARSQPSIFQFRAERNGDLLVLHYAHRGFLRSRPFAWEGPLNHFGYQAQLQEERNKLWYGKQFSDPLVLLASVLTTQLGFLVLGLWNIGRASAEGRSLPHLLDGRPVKAILVGLAGGLVLLAVALVNGLFMKLILGCSPPKAWKVVQEFVPWARVSIFLFAVVVSPIAEEVFFRGYLFGRFKREGHIGFGMVTSAFLFAAMHFHNPYGLAAFFAFGLVLAWLYHRTGSLLSCITAHAANNGLALLWLLTGKC